VGPYHRAGAEESRNRSITTDDLSGDGECVGAIAGGCRAPPFPARTPSTPLECEEVTLRTFLRVELSIHLGSEIKS
jgi:hypothetical protein